MPRPPSLASPPRGPSFSPPPPPDLNTTFLTAPAATASPLLYPTIDPDELAENLFLEAKEDEDAAPPLLATEETLIAVPGAQLHLVDPNRSVDLSAGMLSIVRLLQGGHSVASGHASSQHLRHLLSW
jgi:spartin